MYYRELMRMTAQLACDCYGARVDRITDGPEKLIFGLTRYLGGDGYQPYYLVIDFMSAHLDVYPIHRPPKAPAVPHSFTMLLRKYLESQRVAAVTLSADDRILTITFGSEACLRHALIAELTGRQSNVFFIDLEQKTILGSVWRDSERRHASREVHDFYLPPPPPSVMDRQMDRFSKVDDAALPEAIGVACVERDRREAFEGARNALQKRLEQAKGRLSRRMDALYRDLEKMDEIASVRGEADLLAAYAWQIAPGSKEACLPDFVTGKSVCIALDPMVSIRENIERRYKRCKRASRALPLIEGRLEEAQGQQIKIDEGLLSLQSSRSLAEIDALESCMAPLLSVLLPVGQQTRVKATIECHKPYKTFTSRCGIAILIGKSAKDNDWLTFRVAKGNDWWLHVAHVPGSHVVVKSANPDQETLLDAATLAVHYSKLAQAGHAEVQATQQKNVRRIKGAPPGKVSISQEKIIFVKMEDTRLQRLLRTENMTEDMKCKP